MAEHQQQEEMFLNLAPVQSPAETSAMPSDSDDILSENTRRNSLQAADIVPNDIRETIVEASSGTHSCCQRCLGDGAVPKPCRFCNATGKVRTRSSCVDCEAEKNGCGNTNCKTCQGIGRVMLSNACQSCNGSGKGLTLTCGDCGGSGNCTPRSSSAASCTSIPEEE